MSLQDDFQGHIQRYATRQFDWNAFPSNAGYPELARAQMRMIGSGGSPKSGDTTTLRPEHFTMSLIYKEPGKFAACHAHEIEEAFFILSGVLTVGWESEGEVVEVALGPKDMILNARDIAHGFRNSGIEPVMLSVMVGAGKPLPPRYLYHPKDTSAELAAAFGAQPGHTHLLTSADELPLRELMTRNVIRYDNQKTHWLPAGFGRKIYVGEGGVKATTVRKEMFLIPPFVGVRPYCREVEEAFLVLEGHITVGWEEDGICVEQQIGPRDVILTPAGRRHYFRNNELTPVTLLCVIGTAQPDDIQFEAQS